MQRRKKFSCDFETTTDPMDCRVWAYGIMEIGNTHNYSIGNNLDNFMSILELNKADVFFHNLKFDGSFIINWLLRNGFTYSDDDLPDTFNALISDAGQWYMIDICYGYVGKRKQHTVIYDSLKKLPFSVEQIGQSFKLSSRKIDVDEEFYKRYRPVGHEITEEEEAYIYEDIKVIAEALDIQFQQGLNKITAGSDSLAGFKSILQSKHYRKYFPELSLDLDSEIRLAYRGGFTWLNDRYKNKTISDGIVFDVNSLYPFVMYEKPLPFGKPIQYEGKYEHDPDYPLYIQHIRCEFILNDGYIPTIQVKNKEQKLLFKWNEYLKSSKGERVDLYLTNVDLEIIQEHYTLYDVEWLEGWKFKSTQGLFKKFIDKWTYVKTTEEGAKKQLAKLMLNSLYGKFASNPNVTGKIPYLSEDGSLSFYLEEENYKKPEYTPMGVFITSWARHVTITTAQKCFDRIIYCDTDSIHLEGTETPEVIQDIVDDKKLGYWGFDGAFNKARYIRQKTYAQDILKKKGEDNKIVDATHDNYEWVEMNVTCAGMPKNVKEKVTWDNFHVGLTLDGKLMPKQVAGGVVLEDREFTLKAGE